MAKKGKFYLEEIERYITALSRMQDDVINEIRANIGYYDDVDKLKPYEKALIERKKKIDSLLGYFKKLEDEHILSDLYNEVFG